MEETELLNLGARVIPNREGKYLIFSLADEEYGIETLKVKEIIGIMSITAVPQTPPYIKGVINLRGKVVPIVDLRGKFGMDAIEFKEKTCIIVADVGRELGDALIGMLVDSVSEVINIKSGEIENTPDFGCRLNTDYILGMAKCGGKIKILLDIDRVLSGEEIKNEIELQDRFIH